MMVKVNYSPLSLEDLKSTREYIAINLGSPKAAQNTITKITRRIRDLEGSPEIGTRLSAICSVESDYRFLVSDKYLVFYRYDADSVYIVRILYGGMDYLSVLFNHINGIE